MPQATDELRKKFPGSDQEALEVIRANFEIVKNGVIHPRHSGYLPSPREDDAIEYLFQEWDYEYSTKTVCESLRSNKH